jgi:DNA gyrase subunit A
MQRADPTTDMSRLIEYIPAPGYHWQNLPRRSGARKAISGRARFAIINPRAKEPGRCETAAGNDEHQVNKASMIDKITQRPRTKRIEGISHVQDESDRNGVRVVVELNATQQPKS